MGRLLNASFLNYLRRPVTNSAPIILYLHLCSLPTIRPAYSITAIDSLLHNTCICSTYTCTCIIACGNTRTSTFAVLTADQHKGPLHCMYNYTVVTRKQDTLTGIIHHVARDLTLTAALCMYMYYAYLHVCTCTCM